MPEATRRKREIAQAMEETRARTLRLLDRTPEAFFKARVHDFYSPVGWHFGHVGMTEEYWVCNQALRQPCLDDHLTFLFANLPENPKDNRVHLPSSDEIRAYLAATRQRTLRALQETELDSTDPLLVQGYAWEFALRHECQHQETIAEMLQLIRKRQPEPLPRGEPLPLDSALTEMISLPGGVFLMGSDDPFGYDNEKRRHPVEVAPFQLDRTPVTASQWRRFCAEGGYQRPELWTPEGWTWREAEGAELPEYWLQDADGGYGYAGAFGTRCIHPDEPAGSVSWFEADAYARWAGKRLPTEAEWEFAAVFDPATGQSRRYPWGDSPPASTRACFGMETASPGPVGGKPQGASAFGLRDMAGGLWEWTATPFLPYPGFRAYPYDGYSKDHMDGKHYVCRGGSWATAGPILRSAFRNWYVPTYRQGFLGVRCAR